MTESDSATGATRLRAVARVAGSRMVAHRVLGADRERWLGEAAGSSPDDQSLSRYELDLEMPFLEGSSGVSLHKAAVVDLGELHQEVVGGPMCVQISWRAASLAPLFPVFSGILCWSGGELRLDGFYAPPGGRAGAVADRVLMRLVAERTGRWLLDRIAAAMATEARGEPARRAGQAAP